MMNRNILYTSLTRISPLSKIEYSVKRLSRDRWENGDYILAEVTRPGGESIMTELQNGRMTKVMNGDCLVGALGIRHATLEATGTWQNIQDDGVLHSLTGAGLFGKLTSKSMFVSDIIQLQYLGHVMLNEAKSNMSDFVPDIPLSSYEVPTIITIGTSMSAGKTMSARIITQILKSFGYKVVNAKLTGAGRYRDILSVKDAGADFIFDFVDAGLPSTIVDPVLFTERLDILLSMVTNTGADVALFEIGASPLEPYNGDIAFDRVKNNTVCSVLCASDPYAAYGIMEAFDFTPTLVTGPATNTIAGAEMIEKLCNVKALNIINPVYHRELKEYIQQLFPKRKEEAMTNSLKEVY
jgi:hypothetical protein